MLSQFLYSCRSRLITILEIFADVAPPLPPSVQMEHRHRKKDTPAVASTHHLFVHVKSLVSANLGEELEVFFHIYDGRENRPLR